MRHLSAVLSAGLLLALGGSATAAAATSSSICSAAYYHGYSRLGPAKFQTSGSVAPMLVGYNRLAGLTAPQFIAKYWDPTANGGAGGWRYPPDNGFLGAAGIPIEFVSPLVPGEELDRFGSEFGSFLAPEDTPYADRSLPPQSLDDFDPGYTCNYHLYRVIKPFAADEGPIAPAFGQPGSGLQIQLNGSLVPGAPSALNVMWLVNNGYLARAN